MTLNLQSKEDLAIPLLEEAVEIDPEFAMAFAKLSVAYGNEGDPQMARRHARRAFDLADKLPPRERFYIQGRYYSLSPDTIGESIEAYTKELELFPDHLPARNNVAIELINLERYDEGIEHLEELRRQGHRFAGTFNSLANAYAITGRYEDAVGVLRDYTEANPDNAEGYNNLAVELTRAGHFDEALAALARAQELRPDPRRFGFEAGVHMLAEQFDAAFAALDRLGDGGSEPAAHQSLLLGADVLLYFGRADEARAALDEAVAMAPTGGPLWSAATAKRAELEQLLENPARVLELVAAMRAEGFEPGFEQTALLAEGLAYAMLGNEDAVRERRAEVFQLLAEMPLPPRTRRRIDHQIDGIMAFARRDFTDSARNLEQALMLLPTRDITDEGVVLRYYLARSLWRLGREQESIPHLEAIRDATLSRGRQGVIWVRSLWLLGKFHADQGNTTEARRHYERFLRYWGDGELDRDQVEEARAYLQGAPR